MSKIRSWVKTTIFVMGAEEVEVDCSRSLVTVRIRELYADIAFKDKGVFKEFVEKLNQAVKEIGDE